MFNAVSKIVVLNQLKVKRIDCSEVPSYEDPSVTISSVPLIQSKDEKLQLDDE